MKQTQSGRKVPILEAVDSILTKKGEVFDEILERLSGDSSTDGDEEAGENFLLFKKLCGLDLMTRMTILQSVLRRRAIRTQPFVAETPFAPDERVALMKLQGMVAERRSGVVQDGYAILEEKPTVLDRRNRRTATDQTSRVRRQRREMSKKDQRNVRLVVPTAERRKRELFVIKRELRRKREQQRRGSRSRSRSKEREKSKRRRRRKRRKRTGALIGARGDARIQGQTLDWEADVAGMLSNRFVEKNFRYLNNVDVKLYMLHREMFQDMKDVVDAMDQKMLESVTISTPTGNAYEGVAITREWIRNELSRVDSLGEWISRSRLPESFFGVPGIDVEYRGATSLACDFSLPQYSLKPSEVLRESTTSLTYLEMDPSAVRDSMTGDAWIAMQRRLRSSKVCVVLADEAPRATLTTTEEMIRIMEMHRDSRGTFPGVFLIRHMATEETYWVTVMIMDFFSSRPDDDDPDDISDFTEGGGISRLQRDILIRSAEAHLRMGHVGMARTLVRKGVEMCASNRERFGVISRGFSTFCRLYRGRIHPRQASGPFPTVLAGTALYLASSCLLYSTGNKMDLERLLWRFHKVGNVDILSWDASATEQEVKPPFATFNGIWMLRRGPTKLRESFLQERKDLLCLYLLSALRDDYLSGVFAVSLAQDSGDVSMLPRRETELSEENDALSLLVPGVINGEMTADMPIWNLLSLRGDAGEESEGSVQRCATRNGTVFAPYIWDDVMDAASNIRREAQQEILEKVFPQRTTPQTVPETIGAKMQSRVAPTRDMAVYCFDTILSVLDPTHVAKLRRIPDEWFVTKTALFVTWKKKKKLRGCIGTFERTTLVHGLAEYAKAAAFRDRRFRRITRREVPDLHCEVSILVNFEETEDIMDWEVGVHGIRIFFRDELQAVYLPEVAAERGWSKRKTLENLVLKAGWTGSFESAARGMRVVRFQSRKLAVSYDEYDGL